MHFIYKYLVLPSFYEYVYDIKDIIEINITKTLKN